MVKEKKAAEELEEKVFQTTVRLPEALHRAFKAKCATEGKKITSVLKDLIESYVSTDC